MTTIPDQVFQDFAQMCASDTAEAFEHLTCTEANKIAKVLAAGGDTTAAAWMLIGHASGDFEEDDLHYVLFDEPGLGDADQQLQRATRYVREALI